MRIRRSGELSLGVRHNQFDPAVIPPFSVIRCRYQFKGDPQSGQKRFVCLAHQDGAMICIKATSQIEAYRNNPKKMAGVVFYEAGSIFFFEKDTVIQPDNYFAMLHSTLAKQRAAGDLIVLGAMPDGFRDALIEAVVASETMTPKAQTVFINILLHTK